MGHNSHLAFDVDMKPSLCLNTPLIVLVQQYTSEQYIHF